MGATIQSTTTTSPTPATNKLITTTAEYDDDADDRNDHVFLEMEQAYTDIREQQPVQNGELRKANNELEILDVDDPSFAPKAVPETDDDDDDDERPFSLDPRSGVDDGLLPPDDKRKPNNNNHPDDIDSHIPRPIPKPKRPSFAFPGYDGPDMVDVNGVMTPIPDVNAYQHKKTLAQGMMDLALLSANANQLRYVLETYKRHPYYYPSLIFISISIILQIVVGVGLILNSRYNIKDEKEICRANKINNYTVIGIFIVTIVNVFISAFGVADPSGDG